MAATPPPSGMLSFVDLLPSATPQLASSPITTRFPVYHAQRDLESPMPGSVLRPGPSDRLHSRVRSAPSPTVKNAYLSHHTPIIGHTAGDTSTPIAVGDASAPSWNNLYSNNDTYNTGVEDSMVFASPTKAHPPSTPTKSVIASPFSSPLNGIQTKRRKAQLTGLGTPGAHRGVKRSRQATLDANSMPMSPSRRSREPSTSFTTSRPLASRSASTSSAVFLHPSNYSMDRNVSNVSILSTATTTLMSPPLSATSANFPVDHLTMLPSSSLTSIPDLGGSNQASPSFSVGQSPHIINTPTAVTHFGFASPETDMHLMGHGEIQVQGEMTLMSNVMSAMPPNSLPNSTSMTSVSSFPGATYRQNTLSTISETPIQENAGYFGESVQPGQYPTQPDMGLVNHFQHVNYPPVPGAYLSHPIGGEHPESPDIGSWADQAHQALHNAPGGQSYHHPSHSQPQPAYGYTQQLPNVPGPRHASQSFLYQQARQTDVPAFIPPQRSVSMSHVPQVVNTHQQFSMPHHMSAGGLFPQTHSEISTSNVHMPRGDAHTAPLPQTATMPQAGPSMMVPDLPTLPHDQKVFADQTSQQWDTTNVALSPDTPRKRKYPPIGTRMKPGPKPKPKTPKKETVMSSPIMGEEMPLASGSGTGGSGSINPSLLAGSSIAGDACVQEEEEVVSSPAVPTRLEFGPSLTTLSVQLKEQSSSSFQPIQQSHSYDSLQPSASGSSLGDLNASTSAPELGGCPSSQEQPTLRMAPPRQITTPSESQQSGLPRNFLEKLYSTQLTLEGSRTGSAVKRFKCLIEGCDRTFPRKSAIHSHIQTHLEDKPFQCDTEGCNAAFVRQHDLRRHSRIHSGNKPHQCPCGKTFARGDALARHRQRGICVGGQNPANSNIPNHPPNPTSHLIQMQGMPIPQPIGLNSNNGMGMGMGMHMGMNIGGMGV